MGKLYFEQCKLKHYVYSLSFSYFIVKRDRGGGGELGYTQGFPENL